MHSFALRRPAPSSGCGIRRRFPSGVSLGAIGWMPQLSVTLPTKIKRAIEGTLYLNVDARTILTGRDLFYDIAAS